MIQVYKPHDTTVKLLGIPAVKLDEKYRQLKFLLKYEVEKGLLIYNVLTRELILLSNEEREHFENPVDLNNETVLLLIKKWVLVPENTDEVNISKQIYSFLSNFFFSNTNPIHIFTIFPTTACNARCFYCFENGRTQTFMSPKTAEDVADFIIKKSKGVPIKIRWFGGEPLYNSEVMDIICDKLINAGVKFNSHITTNGYLFTPDIIKKAVDKWNISAGVQITLDGTEEIYNKVKNFIYNDGRSAFRVVLENIGNLVKAGVKVSIRLNMDEHNAEDLYKLSDILYERFGEYKNFIVYAHLLFEDSSKVQLERSDVERHMLLNKYLQFSEHLEKQYKRRSRNVKNLMQYHQCMADDPATTTILPDGSLGKCEHYSDTDFWGSIYSDEINMDAINEFRRLQDLGKQCEECELKPMCFRLVRCAQTVDRCDEADKKLRLVHVGKLIMTTYKEFLDNENGITKEGDDSNEIEVQSDC